MPLLQSSTPFYLSPIGGIMMCHNEYTSMPLLQSFILFYLSPAGHIMMCHNEYASIPLLQSSIIPSTSSLSYQVLYSRSSTCHISLIPIRFSPRDFCRCATLVPFLLPPPLYSSRYPQCLLYNIVDTSSNSVTSSLPPICPTFLSVLPFDPSPCCRQCTLVPHSSYL